MSVKCVGAMCGERGGEVCVWVRCMGCDVHRWQCMGQVKGIFLQLCLDSSKCGLVDISVSHPLANAVDHRDQVVATMSSLFTHNNKRTQRGKKCCADDASGGGGRSDRGRCGGGDVTSREGLYAMGDGR